MRYMNMRFPGGKTKAVTLSYDDGVKADMHLSDLLEKYRMYCTFNINSGFIAKESGQYHLTKEDIQKYIVDRGHEVALHGEHHIAPGRCSSLTGIQDVLFCRRDLEKTFHSIIRGYAYPDSGIRVYTNGANYEKIRGYLEGLGIAYARALGKEAEEYRMPTDFLAWYPTMHHDHPKSIELARKFIDLDIDSQYISSRDPKLFYMWGHSYEFDRNNNWEHLDELLQILSGHDDIYYGTNMDIYRCQMAYDRLEISCDHSLVYNPNLSEVWFSCDDDNYCIKPGETLELPYRD